MNLKRLLFILLIFLMPFYFQECSVKDYAAGFPLFYFSSETAFVWKQAALALGVNVVFAVLLGFVLHKWFKSTTYQKRAAHFTLSNWLCFIYAGWQFVWGWIFLGYHFLSSPTQLFPDTLYTVGSVPIMYVLANLGAVVVGSFRWVVGIRPESEPISELARLSLPFALFNLYWMSYVLTLLFLWVKKKWGGSRKSEV